MLGAFLLVLLAGLGAGTWYLTRLPALSLNRVEVTGGITLDEGALRARVEDALEGSYLFLIPKRFLYTYPHDALVELIEHEPRSAGVTIERDGQMLSVHVTEHIPVALWCAESEVHEGCVFLSEGGEAFDQAPRLEGAVLHRYVTEGRAPEAGVPFAPAAFLADTEAFAEALERQHGMRARSITRTADGDLRYRILGGGEIAVAADAPVDEVFANLDSVLGSAEFAHLAPGNFAYIDLRFGNKVFVKEGLATTTSTSTASSE